MKVLFDAFAALVNGLVFQKKLSDGNTMKNPASAESGRQPKQNEKHGVEPRKQWDNIL